jgi:hypothetical protein
LSPVGDDDQGGNMKISIRSYRNVGVALMMAATLAVAPTVRPPEPVAPRVSQLASPAVALTALTALSFFRADASRGGSDASFASNASNAWNASRPGLHRCRKSGAGSKDLSLTAVGTLAHQPNSD